MYIITLLTFYSFSIKFEAITRSFQFIHGFVSKLTLLASHYKYPSSIKNSMRQEGLVPLLTSFFDGRKELVCTYISLRKGLLCLQYHLSLPSAGARFSEHMTEIL
ncbi:hypothetical protein OWV82_021555 [Melia azedarach]|uniref:Uncharacterized protein n=1 Tax=Melia azedarach TaxID=155640 RepID=A0ACC1X003_MELAZ|nr:hypothetical protein OWV82_021555 [Melia azedarach]